MFLVIGLIVFCDELFADGINLNSASLGEISVSNSELIYFLRHCILGFLLSLPVFAVYIASYYEKSFSKIKTIFLSFIFFPSCAYLIERTNNVIVLYMYIGLVLLCIFICSFYCERPFLNIVKSVATLLVSCFIYYIIFILPMPIFTVHNHVARLRACYSNLRVIQGAVEMYNMDVDKVNKMDKLNMSNLTLGGYVKPGIKCPEANKDLYSGNNLLASGTVMCGPEPYGSIFVLRDYFGKEHFSLRETSFRRKYHGSISGK